jgi:hypothetical protein
VCRFSSPFNNFQAHESVHGGSEFSATSSFNSLSNSDIAPGTQLANLSLPLQRKRNIPKSDDPDFQQGSWAKLCHDVGIPLGPFQDSNVTFTRVSKILSLCPKMQRIPAMLLFIKSARLSDDGLFALVKDPSGEMDAAVHYSVLDEYKSDLVQGSSLIIRNACLLSVSSKRQIINIVLKNVVCVQPPVSVHLPTQVVPNTALSADDHSASHYSSFQKLRDLQAPLSARQVSQAHTSNASFDSSAAACSPISPFPRSRASASSGVIDRFEQGVPSQVEDNNPENSMRSVTESASSSSVSSQAFVLQRVVPGLSQYLAAKRAREEAAATQIGRPPAPPAIESMHAQVVSAAPQHASAWQVSQSNVPLGDSMNCASSSGRSVGSASSAASSRGGAVPRWQSPVAAHVPSSRLCDPDDESALDVD